MQYLKEFYILWVYFWSMILSEPVKPNKAPGFGLWVQGKPVPRNRDGLRVQQSMRNEWPEYMPQPAPKVSRRTGSVRTAR